MKLEIQRSKWLTGSKSDCSLLLAEPNQEGEGPEGNKVQIGGMMCCLGFFGVACGVKTWALESKGEPGSVGLGERKKWQSLAPWLFENDPRLFNQSQDCYDLMRINDNSLIAEADRETKIAEIFARHNVEVSFVD